MDWKVALLAVALGSAGAGSAGLWAAAAQARGALKHVAKYPPASWRIQLCNRNASRGGTRVDWIGFNNCVRNASLQPSSRKKRRR